MAKRRDPEGLRLMAEVVTGLSEVHSPAHAKTLSARQKLASINWNLGRKQEGRAMMEKTCAEAIAQLGLQDRVTLKLCHEAGVICMLDKDPTAASRYRWEAMRGGVAVDKPDSAANLERYKLLKTSLTRAGDTAGLRELHAWRVAAYTEEYGADHRKTQKIPINRAWWLLGQQDLVTAQPIFQHLALAWSTDNTPDWWENWAQLGAHLCILAQGQCSSHEIEERIALLTTQLGAEDSKVQFIQTRFQEVLTWSNTLA